MWCAESNVYSKEKRSITRLIKNWNWFISSTSELVEHPNYNFVLVQIDKDSKNICSHLKTSIKLNLSSGELFGAAPSLVMRRRRCVTLELHAKTTDLKHVIILDHSWSEWPIIVRISTLHIGMFLMFQDSLIFSRFLRVKTGNSIFSLSDLTLIGQFKLTAIATNTIK